MGVGLALENICFSSLPKPRLSSGPKSTLESQTVGSQELALGISTGAEKEGTPIKMVNILSSRILF